MLKNEAPTKTTKTKHQICIHNETKRHPEISQKIPEITPEAPKDVPGAPLDPQTTPKAPHSSPKASKDPQQSAKGATNDPQRTPRDAFRIHRGVQKALTKAPQTTPRRNQNSKWKIDATVIATATPPTQLSNNTASTMTSAWRNARSDLINNQNNSKCYDRF